MHKLVNQQEKIKAVIEGKKGEKKRHCTLSLFPDIENEIWKLGITTSKLYIVLALTMQESNMHEIPDLEIFERLLSVHASIYLNIMIYVDCTMHFKEMPAEPKNTFFL